MAKENIGMVGPGRMGYAMLKHLIRKGYEVTVMKEMMMMLGMAGGEPGAVGINEVQRADGSVETLPATAETDMAPGRSASLMRGRAFSTPSISPFTAMRSAWKILARSCAVGRVNAASMALTRSST